VSATAGDAPPWVVTIAANGEVRSFPVESWEKLAPGIVAGALWGGPEGGLAERFTVRPTSHRDAELSIALKGAGVDIPLPVELIAHYHSPSGGTTPMPELYALSDDEGFVVTMLLSAPTGLYV